MTSAHALNHLNAEQLRALAAQLMQHVESQDNELRYRKTRIDQLTHEIALLKRHRFAKRSEQFSAGQASLLDDLLDTDLAAIEAELEELKSTPIPSEPRQQPRRAPLPPQFPRKLIHHEPENTQCGCGCALKRIGEDVSEKLDYTPGVFTVERHIREKWVCDQCETLIQAPVPPHVIDKGIPTTGLLAHARRKFYDLHVTNKSQIAEQTLKYIAILYEIEREIHDLGPAQRQRLRQEKAAPITDALHAWMIGQRQLVPDGSAIAKALDYSLKRWSALVRYLEDGTVPIDNNWIENRIRPWALGRSNWLFAGSLRSGQRAAALMSLIQSARLNGHDPYAYLKDVLTRLPMQRASEVEALLPHRWSRLN